jgi:hypothetical protein
LLLGLSPSANLSLNPHFVSSVVIPFTKPDDAVAASQVPLQRTDTPTAQVDGHRKSTRL